MKNKIILRIVQLEDRDGKIALKYYIHDRDFEDILEQLKNFPYVLEYGKPLHITLWMSEPRNKKSINITLNNTALHESYNLDLESLKENYTRADVINLIKEQMLKKNDSIENSDGKLFDGIKWYLNQMNVIK